MLDERPRARALRLLRDLASGAVAVGQPLPPERELAERCQVSRTTLRWALARLGVEGVIHAAGAKTRLVAAPVAAASGAVRLFSGSVVGDRGRSGGWGDFLHLGALDALRALGRDVLIPGAGIPDAAAIAGVLRERPAGVLLPEAMISGVTDARLAQAATAFTRAGIPTVIFGEEPADCDRVCSDHEAGAHALSAWLLARGRRRQLCVWAEGGTQPWRERRRAGHERALREAGGGPPAVEWVRWRHHPDDFDELVITLAGHLAPHLLAAEPPTAVLALTDGHVPAICAALRRCGREPGVDVLVTGYDAYWHDVPHRARCPVPPAASVDKGNAALGAAMVALLEERIAGGLPAAPQLRMIAPRLITA